MKRTSAILFLICSFMFPPLVQEVVAQQNGAFEIARIKYRGGGDWYNDPSSLKPDRICPSECAYQRES